MYNEKIEQLIKAALADGVLTEKEKQVLFKRAQEQGIDLDEFEMVLDARLVELQKEEKEKSQKSAPTSDKIGDVRKCPACGALVPALASACVECGYEFTGIKSNLSSQALADKLEKINLQYEQKISGIGGFDVEKSDQRWQENKSKVTTIANTIKTFPIPNTKADLFEFITIMQARMCSELTYKLEAEACYIKYNEAIIKCRAMCASDPLFANIISQQQNIAAEYKKAFKKQKSFGMKPSLKTMLWGFLGPLGLLALIGIVASILGL